ncbi:MULTISPECIES: hypothetical protein [Brevibacillus]|uniref:hypothetical protein n=1 Tax=Brevibacillus TaxID=55080 RepID=UPI0015EEA5B4|nr:MULTISPECIES: hypothetical protein [Brevibacillus]MBA4531497.1 hypothetical protein [Brevibacillus halotolerans]
MPGTEGIQSSSHFAADYHDSYYIVYVLPYTRLADNTQSRLDKPEEQYLPYTEL